MATHFPVGLRFNQRYGFSIHEITHVSHGLKFFRLAGFGPYSLKLLGRVQEKADYNEDNPAGPVEVDACHCPALCFATPDYDINHG